MSLEKQAEGRAEAPKSIAVLYPADSSVRFDYCLQSLVLCLNIDRLQSAWVDPRLLHAVSIAPLTSVLGSPWRGLLSSWRVFGVRSIRSSTSLVHGVEKEPYLNTEFPVARCHCLGRRKTGCFTATCFAWNCELLKAPFMLCFIFLTNHLKCCALKLLLKGIWSWVKG